jgi:hypothetical protein
MSVEKKKWKREILTSMEECEKEGLDDVNYLIKSLEKESERGLGF